MPTAIHIVGARQHNLKNVDVTIPRNALVVITGLSGSGKSSLAFDTLYAEGQRRYVESLSAYARQFLDRLEKPKVEKIEGLSPAIAIEQRSAGSNPRSIVATTTEIYDYLRLLYAHIGIPHCPVCGREIHGQSAEAIRDRLLRLPEGTRFMLLAPYVSGRKGEHREVLEKMTKDGFVRARIDGEIRSLDTEIKLEKNIRHTLEAVIDRLVAGSTPPARAMDSVELALRLGNGILTVFVEDKNEPGGWREETISEHLACVDCDLSFGELQPRNFSFNSPYGACTTCHGLGSILVIQPDLLVPDHSLSIQRGAVAMWRRGPRRLIIYYNHLLRCLANHYDFSLTAPWSSIPENVRRVLLYGSGEAKICFDYWHRGKLHHMTKPFEGIIPNLMRRFQETESETVQDRLRGIMGTVPCPDCGGARLKPEYLAVKVRDLSIHELCSLSIDDARNFFDRINLQGEEAAIAEEITREIVSRLNFLSSVGLNYLTLNRESGTLSGGEAQRIRLATQVGSGLVGVLYILDEPSIGLHQRDNERLLATLTRLRDLGNTVIVVEHDMATMEAADYIVDLGPGAGRLGGKVVFAGPPSEIRKCEASLTGQYMSGTRAVPIPPKRLPGNGTFVVIKGAEEHNLKNIDVQFPLGTLCCVTGVSGSGKSTLVNTILRRAVHQHLDIKTEAPGKHREVIGLEHIDKLIVIDQSPIGRTPRSNPATYTGAFDIIRQLFAKVPEARVRGYRSGRFSFNVKGGRCEDCKGDGIKKIEMQFLPDVYVQCETCQGKRYNQETLNIRYRGRNISDVLEMTVNEACEVFEAVPPLKRKLETLRCVGLGYIHLGQPATTLSGGEAQRVKLSSELAKRGKGHTLYILDEPTTGLHVADIENLLQVLLSLRDQGNTVLVIEHNLDVIKVADHIIDLGPEGGNAGGTVVAEGTPEAVAQCSASFTGTFLKDILAREGQAEQPGKMSPKSKKKPDSEQKQTSV